MFRLYVTFLILVSACLSNAHMAQAGSNVPAPDDAEYRAHAVVMLGNAAVLKVAHTMVARYGFTLVSVTPRYDAEDKATYVFAYTSQGAGVTPKFNVTVHRAVPASASYVTCISPVSTASK